MRADGRRDVRGSLRVEKDDRSRRLGKLTWLVSGAPDPSADSSPPSKGEKRDGGGEGDILSIPSIVRLSCKRELSISV